MMKMALGVGARGGTARTDVCEITVFTDDENYAWTVFGV